MAAFRSPFSLGLRRPRSSRNLAFALLVARLLFHVEIDDNDILFILFLHVFFNIANRNVMRSHSCLLPVLFFP